MFLDLVFFFFASAKEPDNLLLWVGLRMFFSPFFSFSSVFERSYRFL